MIGGSQSTARGICEFGYTFWTVYAKGYAFYVVPLGPYNLASGDT